MIYYDNALMKGTAIAQFRLLMSKTHLLVQLRGYSLLYSLFLFVALTISDLSLT